jgi:peroxiredoxin
MPIRLLLTTCALLAVTQFGNTASLNIASDAEAVQPVQVGQQAPKFTVQQVDGSDYNFNPTQRQRPALIITFRGGWCPFCNMQLQELRHVVPELKASGYEVLFLSSDRPEILYSSLKDENQQLDYTILSDANMQAASALGIAFKIPAADVERMATAGLDLEATTGNALHALPVPSVFIIDTAGIVRFAYVNPDYRVRLAADDVRAAAMGLLQPL